jgi:predicted nucleotidyltransferase
VNAVDDLEYFRATFGLREEDVLFVPFGSRVYGTHSEESDYDYLAIVPADRRAMSRQEYRRNAVNIQIYNRRHFQEDLDEHRIHALEAYFMPDGIVRAQFTFRLERRLLRSELMRKSSHSWVRAKKKMEIENDPVIGRKSLFHSLRILDFAIQIAARGAITDYSSANAYWEAICAAGRDDWAYHHAEYHPEYRRLASAFRKASQP